MSFLSYSKEKALLTAVFAIVGIIAAWAFFRFALQALDTSVSPIAPVAFVVFLVFGWPLLIGVVLINRLALGAVANSTILAAATVLTLAYLYVLASAVAAIHRKFRK